MTCDRVHSAPTCNDPACFREESARRADECLPGLGDLVRRGLLDPDQPRPRLSSTDQWTEGPAKIVSAEDPPSSWKVAALENKPVKR